MERIDSKKSIWYKIKRDRWLCLMFLPIFVYYLVFTYQPMPGLYLAFSKYLPGSGIFSGKFVGFKNFERFFISPFSGRLLRNTFEISLLGLVCGFPAPIIFALCVNEVRNKAAKRFVQTVSYLPYFISTVVVVGMLKYALAYNDGVVNNLLASLGYDRVNFFGRPEWFRPLYIGSGVWQGFGFSSILYLSAIVGINPELYEAAKIDGITKWKEVWYITLPMMKGIIITCLLLNLGGLMSVGFDKVFLMYSEATYETADVISTYVYRTGIEGNQISFSTAVGLFNSVVTFTLVALSNLLCRKVANMSLW